MWQTIALRAPSFQPRARESRPDLRRILQHSVGTALGLACLALSAVAAPSEVRLSFFAPQGDRTAWIRLTPLARPVRREVLTTFPGHPTKVRAAWSADRQQNLVWFESDDDAANSLSATRPRLYWVTPGRAARELVLPPLGSLRDVGFERGGAAIALTLAPVTLTNDHHGHRVTTFAGKRYSILVGAEGIPVLVHAFRLNSKGQWQRFETALSTDGWDYAMGVEALKASRTLQFRADQVLGSQPAHDEVTDKPTLAALHAAAPTLSGANGDMWWRLKGPPTPVYCWSITGELTYATGRVFFGGPQPTVAPNLPWGPTDQVALNWRGQYLLASDAGSGKQPRLYDLKTRALVFSDDAVLDTIFWPD
jgi:hypothetical protein